MNPSWHNASKSRPCPVCGHKDWCTISNDGEVAVCRRVPSPKPGGGTWRPGLDGAKRLGRTLGLPFRIVLPPPGVKDFSDWNQAGGMCPSKFWSEAAAFWQGPYTKGER